jgi:hypothetical protein
VPGAVLFVFREKRGNFLTRNMIGREVMGATTRMVPWPL